ncbi:MAG TPA: histidine phosphatase family protein, partial [Gemmatimonadaceae bacterium]|nr:histidine phosphatase family protein [Gemmatimonadaceae bacterium]
PFLLAAAAIVSVGATGATLSQSRTTAPTVVLLVRHAEKAAEPAQDPPLTEGGQARAHALVEVARDAGVTAIITTQFDRTRSTAAPTATALKLTPEVVGAGPLAQHAKAVADRVRKHAGGTVLVVGHSNTIPAIVGALGAPQPREICDGEYDRLFVVVMADTGAPRLVRSRFGAASPDDPSCPAMQPR